MPYSLFKDLITYAEEFEKDFKGEMNVQNFSGWLSKKTAASEDLESSEPNWEGKEMGRSADSVISTAIVHLFRYAKYYSKIAVANSPFATIDEVIFLLVLLHRGSMTKIQLIELNIHEKSTGIQIINRLLQNGFIAEDINESDKRSKKISITEFGKAALHDNMDKIRKATTIVSGDLNKQEKMELISLLQKLVAYHKDKIKGRISL